MKADLLFLKFGKDVQCLYGNNVVIPNMHLHCHLKECMLDLGPVHVNGISIEVQLMRKLLVGRFVRNVEFPEGFSGNFMQFFEEKKESFVENFNVINASKLFKGATCRSLADFQWSDIELVGLQSCYKLLSIGAEDLNLLLSTYRAIYPDDDICLSSLSVSARKYPRISL